MKSLLPAKSEPFHIELLRDQVRVIERRGGDPAAAKKAFTSLNRNFKTLPRGTGDTVRDLNKTRESRGRL